MFLMIRRIPWDMDGLGLGAPPGLIRRHYKNRQPLEALNLKIGDVVALTGWTNGKKDKYGHEFMMTNHGLFCKSGVTRGKLCVAPDAAVKPLFRVVSRAKSPPS
jgi:hypothetical protein